MALTRPNDFTFKHVNQIDDPVYNSTADLKTDLDSQAKYLRDYLISLLTEVDAQLATKSELGGIALGDIPDGTITEAKLSFDPATQTELNTHKTSTDHDGRYYTETETDTLLTGKIDKSLLTTQGDIIYASGSSTPARLAKGTARQQLSMNSGATAPEWVASLQSLMTAQGDIVYATGANTPSRLAIGTALQMLRVNSGATGIEWASPVNVATGSFTGNDAANRSISTGFAPRFVIVQGNSITCITCTTWNATIDTAAGTVPTRSDHLYLSGENFAFYVTYSSSGGSNKMNVTGQTYYYTAIG